MQISVMLPNLVFYINLKLYTTFILQSISNSLFLRGNLSFMCAFIVWLSSQRVLKGFFFFASQIRSSCCAFFLYALHFLCESAECFPCLQFVPHFCSVARTRCINIWSLNLAHISFAAKNAGEVCVSVCVCAQRTH